MVTITKKESEILGGISLFTSICWLTAISIAATFRGSLNYIILWTSIDLIMLESIAYIVSIKASK